MSFRQPTPEDRSSLISPKQRSFTFSLLQVPAHAHTPSFSWRPFSLPLPRQPEQTSHPGPALSKRSDSFTCILIARHPLDKSIKSIAGPDHFNKSCIPAHADTTCRPHWTIPSATSTSTSHTSLRPAATATSLSPVTCTSPHPRRSAR